MNREIERVDVALIDVSEGRRSVDDAHVDQLARSMADIGLQYPIIVRYIEDRASSFGRDDSILLVAGRHRLEAAKRLGWAQIDCIYVDLDDLHAELAEIDENLIRRNLTPSQEAEAIARRKAIYEELHPETTHGGDRKSDQVANSATRFTSNTAKATGKSERAIQVAAARGAALGDDLSAIAGTSLDKGVELDALAKMNQDERKPLIQRARAGERVSARKEPKIAADPLPDALASERQVARLMDAWNAAGPEAREEFLLRIDSPVFDRGAVEREFGARG
jgi:ParB family chromosome partitioning protein